MKNSRSVEAAFWEWFKQNDDALWKFESNQEAVFDSLLKQLQKVHRDLTFEIGPEESGVREFVISAGGMKAAFPAVESLVDAAPTLPRWKFIKFRQRREDMFVVSLGDVSIHPDEVMCTLELNGNKVDITLFLGAEEDFDDSLRQQVGFLFLDAALGEYAVEMFVGYIEMLPAEASSPLTKQPLKNLAAEFDRLVKTMAN
jgi:hypothetical protein